MFDRMFWVRQWGGSEAKPPRDDDDGRWPEFQPPDFLNAACPAWSDAFESMEPPSLRVADFTKTR